PGDGHELRQPGAERPVAFGKQRKARAPGVFGARRHRRRGGPQKTGQHGRAAGAADARAGRVLEHLASGDGGMADLIVVPGYNEAPSIEKVLTQTLAAAPGVDVLVVDDGSTDESPEILRSEEHTSELQSRENLV